jgi:hypothetical protein
VTLLFQLATTLSGTGFRMNDEQSALSMQRRRMFHQMNHPRTFNEEDPAMAIHGVVDELRPGARIRLLAGCTRSGPVSGPL